MEGIGSCRHYGPLRLRLLPLQHYYRPPPEEEIQCEYKQAWVSGPRFRARTKKRLPHDSARRCLPQEPHTINGSFYPNSNFVIINRREWNSRQLHRPVYHICKQLHHHAMINRRGQINISDLPVAFGVCIHMLKSNLRVLLY